MNVLEIIGIGFLVMYGLVSIFTIILIIGCILEEKYGKIGKHK